MGQARAELGFAPGTLQVPGRGTVIPVEVRSASRWAEAALAPSLPSVGPQAGPDHPRGEGGVAVRLGAA